MNLLRTDAAIQYTQIVHIHKSLIKIFTSNFDIMFAERFLSNRCSKMLRKSRRELNKWYSYLLYVCMYTLYTIQLYIVQCTVQCTMYCTMYMSLIKLNRRRGWVWRVKNEILLLLENFSHKVSANFNSNFSTFPIWIIVEVLSLYEEACMTLIYFIFHSG